MYDIGIYDNEKLLQSLHFAKDADEKGAILLCIAAYMACEPVGYTEFETAFNVAIRELDATPPLWMV